MAEMAEMAVTAVKARKEFRGMAVQKKKERNAKTVKKRTALPGKAGSALSRNKEAYLNESQAAVYLGISLKQLRTARVNQKLPHRRAHDTARIEYQVQFLNEYKAKINGNLAPQR